MYCKTRIVLLLRGREGRGGEGMGEEGRGWAGLDWPLCRGTGAPLRRTQEPAGPFEIFR